VSLEVPHCRAHQGETFRDPSQQFVTDSDLPAKATPKSQSADFNLRKRMMTTKLFILIAGCLIFAACSSTTTTNNTNTNASSNAPATPAPPTSSTAQATPTLDPNAPVKFVFADFPAAATTAKTGDFVLCPSKETIIEMSQPNVKDPIVIYYTSKMIKPGATESEVESLYSGGTYTVPNAYLITIPAGQKAKVGEVLLTWWQTGSGMMRAIVTDASNPSEPTVRYLDRLSDQDKLEKLKPDSFVKLSQLWQPGTSVAIKGGSRLEHSQVLHVGGDKVFVKGWGGKVKLVNKADCTAVPINPQVKAGDKVKAMIFGSFVDATVVSVDEKLGKVVVKQDGQSEEKVIDFGDVMKP
jgi:hypothetical protein